MTRTNLTLILIASAAGAVAGAITTSLISPAPQVAEAAPSGSSDARLAELQQSQAKLEQALAELRSSQALLAARPERTALATEAARDAEHVGLNSASALPPAASAETALTVEAALAALCDPNATYQDRAAMWEKVGKAGLLDAVVKSMEQNAEREPNNAQLRVDLGKAYVQEILASSDMAKGKWAVKANSAFDAALELDPNHWEARFTKAVSLSHWPAIWGKQGQAISEFETLIRQQDAGPKKPEHAQSYLFLGNMYESTGAADKALEAWQKGLDLFPDNVELKQQVAGSKHH